MNESTKNKKPKKLAPAVLVALLLGGAVGYESAVYRYTEQAAYASKSAVIQVRFSPGGHCTQFIEEAIAKAQKSILVQAYSFTSLSIADALIAAHKRGIEVRILVDRSQQTGRYTQIPRVTEAGIAVAIDKVPGIAHNKIMIIDDIYVLTGSFNWTQAAEKRNAENLLLINDAKTNSIYKAMWHRRAERAQAFTLE